MIRIDGENRTDFVYDELAEALGEEPGSFTSADLEESMSTHYGRMVHEDDRTIMFANPEDAAEYLGFAPRPPRAADCPPPGRPRRVPAHPHRRPCRPARALR